MTEEIVTNTISPKSDDFISSLVDVLFWDSGSVIIPPEIDSNQTASFSGTMMANNGSANERITGDASLDYDFDAGSAEMNGSVKNLQSEYVNWQESIASTESWVFWSMQEAEGENIAEVLSQIDGEILLTGVMSANGNITSTANGDISFTDNDQLVEGNVSANLEGWIVYDRMTGAVTVLTIPDNDLATFDSTIDDYDMDLNVVIVAQED